MEVSERNMSSNGSPHDWIQLSGKNVVVTKRLEYDENREWQYMTETDVADHDHRAKTRNIFPRDNELK